MASNSYIVEAVFQKARFYYKSEFWEGRARNMAIACRKAIQEIMKRRNVKRLRHATVTFKIEKVS